MTATKKVFAIAMMAVMFGVFAPLGAAKLNTSRTGKALPSEIREAVAELMKDVPELTGLPEGYTLKPEDLVLVEKYQDLMAMLPQKQADFIAQTRPLMSTASRQFPVYIIRESDAYKELELLISRGGRDAAVSVLESYLGHEADHVWFKGEVREDDEAHRVVELRAYQLQLQIMQLCYQKKRWPDMNQKFINFLENAIQSLQQEGFALSASNR
jgi:hypothetical protein